MILIRENYEIGEMDTDIVRSYMEAHSPVNPQIEGRIQIDNTCTRTAEPTNCNPPPSLDASTNRSNKHDFSVPILSLLSLLLEKFFH